MAHELNPNQEDSFLEIGRLIHDDSYKREKKEISVSNMKIDLIKKRDGELIVGEIKKSSHFELPARMQLAFYLYKLRKRGIDAKGELLIPKEKKKIRVELTPNIENELEKASQNIKEIINQEKPPQPAKIRFCRNCAYREFCWV